MNKPSMGFSFVLLLWLIVLRKNRTPHTFWVEPKQETHWNYVECIVWKAIEEMHHKKYMKFYTMNLEAFDNSVRILTAYLKSKCINQVHPWLNFRKIVALVVHRFAHGNSPNHIIDCLKARGFYYKEIHLQHNLLSTIS
jgi:2-iminoacetate synthase ThiH